MNKQLTVTQFAWQCCNAGIYHPPNKQQSTDTHCWLCGGDTHGIGWHKKYAIPDTFCEMNYVKRHDSNAVCQACVATIATAGWHQYVAAYPERGLWAYFPEKEGKTKRPFMWLYTSHVFSTDYHESPSRGRWRELLVNPPQPPFLMIMAIGGKKHIIFRGKISYSRDVFFVQADNESVCVIATEYAECLTDFELLYNLGFSKDSIVSGDYHTGQLAKVGLTAWRPLENRLKHWRQYKPEYLRLCHYCAQREKTDVNPVESPAPIIETPPTVIEQRGQYDLFV